MAEKKYLSPPTIIPAPGEDFLPEKRKFQGIASLAVSPAGRLWAVWYAGITPAEDENNYVVIVTRADSGKSWNEVLYIDCENPVRCFDPEIWLDPQQRLWVFWAQTIGHDGREAGVWALTTDDPESDSPAWSAPRRLTDGIMMSKPTVLRSGEWLMPVSTWRETDNSAQAVASADNGTTWSVRGACHVPKEDREFDEHMIIEKEDHTLWMLVRTKYGIGESVSTDTGRTWSPLSPSDIQHTSSRFFIRRLRSGSLLLVKHGMIDQKTKRCDLRAFISQDDGKTWNGGLLLDERNKISYPSGQEDHQGTISIAYDFSRTDAREILMAQFTEQDALCADPQSETVHLKMQISKTGKGGA